MQPGENVLSVEYKGATNLATLTPDGRIKCVVRPRRPCVPANSVRAAWERADLWARAPATGYCCM